MMRQQNYQIYLFQPPQFHSNGVQRVKKVAKIRNGMIQILSHLGGS